MFVVQCVSEENKSGINDSIKNTKIKESGNKSKIEKYVKTHFFSYKIGFFRQEQFFYQNLMISAIDEFLTIFQFRNFVVYFLCNLNINMVSFFGKLRQQHESS